MIWTFSDLPRLIMVNFLNLHFFIILSCLGVIFKSISRKYQINMLLCDFKLYLWPPVMLLKHAAWFIIWFEAILHVLVQIGLCGPIYLCWMSQFLTFGQSEGRGERRVLRTICVVWTSFNTLIMFQFSRDIKIKKKCHIMACTEVNFYAKIHDLCVSN
jgi:hypothetical protein